jgi:hypothetical protein
LALSQSALNTQSWIIQVKYFHFLPFTPEDIMQLGAFSISLAVKDIHASKAFYEKLGFTFFGGFSPKTG